MCLPLEENEDIDCVKIKHSYVLKSAGRLFTKMEQTLNFASPFVQDQSKF